jgi:hypothetical protein
MFGPIVEVRRNQSQHCPTRLPWERNSTSNPGSTVICERNTANCSEEAQIAAQLEGLPERIASLESFCEK